MQRIQKSRVTNLFKDAYRKEIISTFIESFPLNERIPILFLHKQIKRNALKLYRFTENGEFRSLAIVAECDTCFYLFFLAVNKQFRGHGYGGETLEEIIKMCADKKLFLLAEFCDKNEPENSLKKQRINFYKKYGFELTNMVTKEVGVSYSFLQISGQVSFEDYSKTLPLCFPKIRILLFINSANRKYIEQ